MYISNSEVTRASSVGGQGWGGGGGVMGLSWGGQGVGGHQTQHLHLKKNVCALSLNQQDSTYIYYIFLWLDMVITSSGSVQRLLVTIWFYCVSGFATSVVNCGTTRVPKGLPM
jgi:hypothetical protein